MLASCAVFLTSNMSQVQALVLALEHGDHIVFSSDDADFSLGPTFVRSTLKLPPSPP